VPTVIGDVLSRGFSAAGNHFLKTGFEAVINRYPTNLNLFQFGQFVFGRAVPPGPDNPPVQYLLGQYAYDFADLDSRYFAFFVQDDWKIHPNVTLNLGLRWDLHQYRGTYSGEDFPDFTTRDEAVRFLITTLPGGPNASVRYRMRTDPKDLVQPRLGLAWDVFGNGRTAIRGGYGRFVRGGHDPISVTGVLRAERAQLFIAPGGVFNLLSFFPGPPPEPLKAQFFRASIVSQFPGVFVKDAFAHQANLSVEQRLLESALPREWSATDGADVGRRDQQRHIHRVCRAALLGARRSDRLVHMDEEPRRRALDVALPQGAGLRPRAERPTFRCRLLDLGASLSGPRLQHHPAGLGLSVQRHWCRYDRRPGEFQRPACGRSLQLETGSRRISGSRSCSRYRAAGVSR
jgi:hypothetical protein